jgi:hypothetical protein
MWDELRQGLVLGALPGLIPFEIHVDSPQVKVGQKSDTPAIERLPVFIAYRGSRKAAVRGMVISKGLSDIP